MPSWSKIPRHRRPGDAPRVELAEWVRLISRRVEQQLRRDWLLGFIYYGQRLVQKFIEHVPNRLFLRKAKTR